MVPRKMTGITKPSKGCLREESDFATAAGKFEVAGWQTLILFQIIPPMTFDIIREEIDTGL